MYSSLQVKFGLSYILIIAAVLLLLNTYPLRVSQDLVFRSKEATLESSVSVMVYSLSGLDHLTEENVAQAMAVVEETGMSRILVTDETGRVLYDTRETGSAVGEYAFYTEIVQALLGSDVFTSTYQNGAFRSRASSPVLYQSQVIGAVYAYEYDTEQAALLEGLQANLLRLSAMIGVAVLVLSVVLSRVLTRKIGQLLTAIRQVREGAYSHRAEIAGHDEIAQIGQEFNSLTDRLQTTENARRRFVSDASHELKTPLAAIRLLSDSILQTEHMDPATTREFVADIGEAADRLIRISQELLELNRLDEGRTLLREPVDLNAQVEKAVRLLQPLAESAQVTLETDLGEDCTVLCNTEDAIQILRNLMENAIKYNVPQGKVWVTTRRVGDRGRLEVADTGVGIPQEDMPKIFQRFYRVDKARSRAAGGTGLGLSIVRDAVRRHGGEITVAPRTSAGVVFTVLLLAEEGGAPS